MTKLRNSVGERIRAIRKAKGLTQQQLAELSGLDDAYVGSLERGERNFSIDTLEKVVLALEVPTADLFLSIENSNDQYIQQKAIDEYSVIIHRLSPKKINKFTKVITEISDLIE